LERIQKEIRIVYPAHPRAQKKIHDFKLEKHFCFLKQPAAGRKNNNFSIIDPLGYLDFVMLMSKSRFILTDSGGIQEESTVLNIPCLTMRNNTERPVTIEIGSNKLIGTNKKRIIDESLRIISGKRKNGKIPEFWDGKAAKRIVDILVKKVRTKSKN
jgi:UDP-N-acetylglucosamine 2-epimerase (non-hydrolysing)